MKHLKMIAVAAIAVGAMMALAGASSAAAAESTVLCNTNTTSCGSLVESGETLEASSTDATLATNIFNLVCSNSTARLSVSGVTGVEGPETGTVKSLTFTGCKTSSGTGCTVLTQGFPANGSLQKVSTNRGTLRVTPRAAGTPGAKLVCGSLINCTFSTASATLLVEGASDTEPLKAKAAAIVLDRFGGICPKTSTWTATYTASAPNKGQLFVTG